MLQCWLNRGHVHVAAQGSIMVKLCIKFESLKGGGVNLPVLRERKFLFSAHREISMQGGDWNKKIYHRRINTNSGGANNLKRWKNTTRLHFSLNCFVNPGEGNRIEPFSVCSDPGWRGAKNTPSSLAMCVGRGSSIAPFAPQHGLLSQYRAQTTVALSQQPLNWKLLQPCLCHGRLGRTASTWPLFSSHRQMIF